jgi:1-deoxy-D-xylulose-5-phosphate reductoisomerase
MKYIVILGCTGSIGTSTLDIIKRFPDRFRVSGISAKGSNPDTLVKICDSFTPEIVVVNDPECARNISSRIKPSRLDVGVKALQDLAAGKLCSADIVVSAQSGSSGLLPTAAAVQAGKTVALANKESLVMGGEWMTQMCRKNGAKLLPLDSEHSAIHQCLNAVHKQDVKKLVLTCSGGPFSAQKNIDLNKVTPEQALSHPTWKMGPKISIDSATLMNKGLEIIEARWLFDVQQHNIDVVIHPQSIIHSMVETLDGSVMAQLSPPDMRHPILYALTGERHPETDLPRLDLTTTPGLTFFKPDVERFPCLNLARQALREGGTMPVVLNTANECLVNAFTAGQILFTDIPRIIDKVMQRHAPIVVTDIDTIIFADQWTRDILDSEWGV